MEKNEGLLEEANQYVQHILLDKQPPHLIFHTYEHTEALVEQCEELAEMAGLDGEEREDLLLAAWFHDVGYVEVGEGHEERSAEMAKDFLKKKNYDASRIEKVEKLIKNTANGAEPEGDNEKILHDANWSFLGRKRFFRRGELLRLEQEKLEEKKYSLQEWDRHMLDLQLKTNFYTPWAIDKYGTRKNKNIAKQRDNLTKSKKKTRRRRTGKDFGRGVDTIYRVTLRNHISMSEIADGKANMIISINTLVLSILITAGTAGLSLDTFSLQENINVIAPVFTLMLTALLAIIFAVFSAMPKVSGKELNKRDVVNKKASLLFFGNFLQIQKEEFVDYLNDLKKNQQVLYDDLSRDLYNLGLILKKKYRLLNIAYWVFVGGLILSFLTFVAFSIFYEPSNDFYPY